MEICGFIQGELLCPLLFHLFFFFFYFLSFFPTVGVGTACQHLVKHNGIGSISGMLGADLIPGSAQWVKDLGLLQLRLRFQPLAWQLPKRKKKKMHIRDQHLSWVEQGAAQV